MIPQFIRSSPRSIYPERVEVCLVCSSASEASLIITAKSRGRLWQWQPSAISSYGFHTQLEVILGLEISSGIPRLTLPERLEWTATHTLGSSLRGEHSMSQRKHLIVMIALTHPKRPKMFPSIFRLELLLVRDRTDWEIAAAGLQVLTIRAQWPRFLAIGVIKSQTLPGCSRKSRHTTGDGMIWT